MNANKVLIVSLCVISVFSIFYGVHQRVRYTELQSTLESVNAGELQRQLGLVNAELERARAELAESRESVERLEGVDSRRLAGIERIERSVESIGRGIGSAQGGNERAEIAIRGIAEIVDILEAEFGRGSLGD
ncbi:MAG: hypothetical protein FWH12_02510 [Treponema sp.]|nr:hypothetical protein [Treponema sp.]